MGREARPADDCAGLESLDQPSRVTLIGCTRYVEQGIQYGLAEWKENDWRWEWFGQMVLVRDADLWQRMDRAMQFHRVDCGQRRFDCRHSPLKGPHWNLEPTRGKAAVDSLAGGNWVKYQPWPSPPGADCGCRWGHTLS